MPLRRVCTPVEQLQSFEWGRIVNLREAGWTYRRIAAQQWSVEQSYIRRPGSGRPHSTVCAQSPYTPILKN